ncbi:MAG: molybdenum cofactor biosynthesis protein A [Bacteroidetes bacterium ADurb.Bin408]|nr:MAG: molybdenum cofactor biosynthesis protein A [Bacteroidetes bacterium ADurb.Bin408]
MCSGNLSSAIRRNREQLPPLVHNLPNDFTGQFLPFLRRLKSLELTGGDPFLIDIYYDLLKAAEATHPKLDILITTNANTYNDKVQALLKKNQRLSFNVSIDSLDETTYAQIRCNGSLSKALRNISLFSEYTKSHNTSLGFLVCPLRQNWKELPSFVTFANKYNASLSYHVVFKPAQFALWSLPAKQLEEIAAYLASFEFEENNFYQKINVRSYNSLVALVKSWHQKALLREAHKNETVKYIENEIKKSKALLRDMFNDAEFFKTLETLINQVPVNEYPEMVYMALAQKTQQELLFGYKHFSEEELLKKFILYHQEIYASYFYHLNLSDNDKYSENIL